jgi:hypothetical protein
MDHSSTNDAVPSLPPSPSNSKAAEARRSTATTEQTDYSFQLAFQRSSSVRSSITIDNALKSFNIKEDLDESEHPFSITSHSSHHGTLGLRNPLSYDQEDDHSEFLRRSCDTSDWEEDSVSITSRNMSETEDWVIAVETKQEPQKMNKTDMLGLTLKMKQLDAMESPTQHNHNKTENTYRESFLSTVALASLGDDYSTNAQAEEEQESIVD